MQQRLERRIESSAPSAKNVTGKRVFYVAGDRVVGDAMAQPFSMRAMLIDGQGNFGSMDGDPPAAYRYTEARLSKLGSGLLEDIDKNTVDFQPNYDESKQDFC